MKINSSEERSRQFAKQLYEVYKSLDEVVDAIDKVQLTVKEFGQKDKKEVTFPESYLPDYIRIQWFSPSEGNLTYKTLFIDEQVSERISSAHEINQRDLLPVLLLMEVESWELIDARNKPEKLKALSIYDPELVNTFSYMLGLMMAALSRHYVAWGYIWRSSTARF